METHFYVKRVRITRHRINWNSMFQHNSCSHISKLLLGVTSWKKLEEILGNMRSIQECHTWANDPWTWPERCVCLQVMVILSKTEGMCSVAFRRPHRQQVLVPASSSKLITYTIIPLKTGELPLEVMVIAHSFIELDRVRKNLRVVVSS